MRRFLTALTALAALAALAGCGDAPGVSQGQPPRAGNAWPSDACVVRPGSGFADIGLLQPNDLTSVSAAASTDGILSTVQGDFSAWSRRDCPAGQLSLGNSLLCDRIADWLSHHALDGGGDGMSMSIHVITGGVEIDEVVQYFDPSGVAPLAVTYAMGRCGGRPPSTVQGFRLYKLVSQSYPRWIAVKEHLAMTLTMSPDIGLDAQTDMVAVALTRANDLLAVDSRTRLLIHMGNWQIR